MCSLLGCWHDLTDSTNGLANMGARPALAIAQLRFTPASIRITRRLTVEPLEVLRINWPAPQPAGLNIGDGTRWDVIARWFSVVFRPATYKRRGSKNSKYWVRDELQWNEHSMFKTVLLKITFEHRYCKNICWLKIQYCSMETNFERPPWPNMSSERYMY